MSSAIFLNEASITRLIGAALLEQDNDWLLQHPLHADRELTNLPSMAPERLTLSPIDTTFADDDHLIF